MADAAPIPRVALTLWFACVLTLAPRAAAEHAQAGDESPGRPNILFFITDDESWRERSVYGWSNLPTPELDRVAQDGVLFTNAFTTAPSCAPSRACVLTGRHFWQLDQGAMIQSYVPGELPTFTAALLASGYHVGYTGKSYGPNARPTNVDCLSGVDLGAPYASATLAEPLEDVSDIDYAANFEAFLADRAPGQPFFFWAGVIEPHAPYADDNHVRLEAEFGVTLDQVALPPHMEDTAANRQKRANFVYEICLADRQLGRMLASVEATGELDNTLVVVTSDNGSALLVDGAHYGKASPYDFGVHEPLAIMWPSRVPAGRTVTDFVSFADFAPTFLEAAGVDVPDSVTGRSLLPILESTQSGRIEPERDFIVTGLEWHGEFDPVSRSSRSIRNDQYAYFVRYDNVDAGGAPLSNAALTVPSSEGFFDLVADPWQLTNLADDPNCARQKKQLADKLRSYALQHGDPRFTGEMCYFRQAREYAQERKRIGYSAAGTLAYPLPWSTTDLNFDGFVDAQDGLALVERLCGPLGWSRFGTCDSLSLVRADGDCDGDVDLHDLGALQLTGFGPEWVVTPGAAYDLSSHDRGVVFPVEPNHPIATATLWLASARPDGVSLQLYVGEGSTPEQAQADESAVAAAEVLAGLDGPVTFDVGFTSSSPWVAIYVRATDGLGWRKETYPAVGSYRTYKAPAATEWSFIPADHYAFRIDPRPPAASP